MSYKFTQDCEISNAKFEKGEIISEKDGINYFSSVMEIVNSKPTIKVNIVNGKATKEGIFEEKEDTGNKKAESLKPLGPTKDQIKEQILKLNPDIDVKLLEQNKPELIELLAKAQEESKQLTPPVIDPEENDPEDGNGSEGEGKNPEDTTDPVIVS